MCKNKAIWIVGLLGFAVVLVISFLTFPVGVVQAALLDNGDLTPENGQCVQDYVARASCTAKDVKVRYIKIVNLHEGCNEGTIGELEADFEIVLEAAQPNRYDIGFYIASDGGSALLDSASAGGSNSCYHGYLSNYWGLDPAPVYGNHYADNGDTIPDLWDLDPAPGFLGLYTTGVDTCGDMENGTQAIRTIFNLRVPCNDGSGDGVFDIHTCASWENIEQNDCSSVLQAIPGNTSKCGCEYVNLYGPNDVALVSLNARTFDSRNWLIPAIAVILFAGSAGVVQLFKKLDPRKTQKN
jgi:hypothetical protein